MPHPIELRAQALECLLEPDPYVKAAGVAALAQAHAEGRAVLDAQAAMATTGAIPGRPARPELVHPRQVGRRSMATVEGRAMLVHALAHIEFNAVKIKLEYWTPSPFGERPCLSRSRTRTCASRQRSSPRATH